jgi:hypothetical protein
MTLRKRCKAMYHQMQRDAVLRQGSPVDDLMAFVISEKGRVVAAGDFNDEDAFPLCLYFNIDQDRTEFVEMWKDEHPNAITRKIP